MHPWRYKAEGNANMCFDYTGDDPTLVRSILRVSKKKEANLQFQRDYQNLVMVPLLGADYTAPYCLYRVNEELLTRLDNESRALRPPSRLSTSIHLQAEYALLVPDASALGPASIAFELKPKWMYAPNVQHVRSEHQRQKQRTCRFCMMETYRLHTKKDHVRSDYCPMDLISRDRKRVEYAIACLWNDGGRNLKFWCNGVQVPVDDARFLSALGPNSTPEDMQHLLVDIVMTDPLLSRLAHLQKTLDGLDIEGIYPLYTQLQESIDVHDIHTWTRTLEGVLHDTEPISDAETILRFLMAASIKDASIFFTLQPNSYKISVIDLDVKKLSKIPEYYQQDADIVAHCIHVGFAKSCFQ
jgi:inositol-pentakisphosphate 2-kinase